MHKNVNFTEYTLSDSSLSNNINNNDKEIATARYVIYNATENGMSYKSWLSFSSISERTFSVLKPIKF